MSIFARRQLAFRIALVWTGGILLAVGVRALLPDMAGITLYGKQNTLFVPFSRMGFWTCILGALVVTVLVVFRALIADMGWRNLH